MHSKKLESLCLMAVSVYVVFLGLSRDLDYYIHPRYSIFTIVMAGVCLTVTLTTLIFTSRVKKPSHEHDQQSPLSIFPMALLLMAAFVFPAKALQSATVAQRVSDAQTTRTAEHRDVTLLNGSSRGLGIIDWAQLIVSKTDPAFYQHKPASISGFIFDAKLGSNTVWVARFAVTCCAVDAQPVGVPVHIENWSGLYKQDDWVKVEGEFAVSSTAVGSQLTLIPTKIEKIEEPQNPYVN